MVHFSVIIPLEFHRGLGLDCLRGWTEHQDYESGAYEVVLAVPSSFPEEELEEMKPLLRAHDQILRLALQHDMDLVAEAAIGARGEVLVFTESHCLPNPDFLTESENGLIAHPEWAGFSGRSIPITHNLLSQIESEMYDTDIRKHLIEHPWLKVLDQCFVIRKAAYDRIGGIESEYGHFAEWVLAGRLREAGLKIGYLPQAAIHHYYTGDLGELEEFAEDFGIGQMKFHLNHCDSGKADWFDSPAVWENRHALTRRAAWRMLKMIWNAKNRSTGEGLSGRIGRWVARLVGGAWLDERLEERRASELHVRTFEALQKQDRVAATAAYLELNDHMARLGQAKALRRGAASKMASAGVEKKSGKWTPAESKGGEKVGFGASSEYHGTRLCWSQPEAMIWLPLGAGRYEITLRWLDILSLRDPKRLQLFIDEKPLSNDKVCLADGQAAFTVEVKRKRGVRLGWICPRYDSPGDTRVLGLPLRSISWKRMRKVSLPANAPGDRAAPPLYFLHITKTMGTAVRYALENAFHADDLFSPTACLYYRSELPSCAKDLAVPKQFYRGHFGWNLMASMSKRCPRVITVLRDPTDRMLSWFDYAQQVGYIGRLMGLEEWLQREIRVEHMMVSYFVPDVERHPAKGAEAVGRLMKEHLEQALTNLRHCAAVGLQEKPLETYLLLCRAAGAMPPDPERRINPTKRISRADTISVQARELLEIVNTADQLLFEEARRMFDRHWGELLSELEVDKTHPDAMQQAEQLLRERALTAALMPEGKRLVWTPKDRLLGENLHGRECHDKRWLRWTGPGEASRFYMGFSHAGDWRIRICLHPATPVPHAKAATLTVDGCAVTLRLNLDVSGNAAHLEGTIPQVACRARHEFRLFSPVKKLPGDIRSVGLCLTGMELQHLPVRIHFEEIPEGAPLISVIVTVKNAAELITTTLESILAQGGDDLLECLVQDGGSEDGTHEEARKLNSRISVESRQDNSVYEGMNHALHRARGRWIIFLGAGDRLRPGVLNELSDDLLGDVPALVYGDVWMEDRGLRYAGEFTSDRLARQNLCQQSVFYHRSVFERLGGFDEHYRVLSDYEFNLRCFGDEAVSKKYVPLIVADYCGGGISATTEDVVFEQEKRALVAGYLLSGVSIT